MNRIAVYWAEFRHEIRAGLRGPLFTITAIGLTFYMLMVLTNGNGMRGFGIMRNSATIMYQFSTGMSMFLFFAWAWVFGQVVVRDRNVHLDENVLSSPVRLPRLLFARYLGATVVAFLLGAVIPLSFFLSPVLVWLKLVPQEAVGAAPVLPVLLSLLLFVLPTALGIGALFVSSALRTRSTAGPLVVAALLMLIWMIGLIVFRDGDISDNIAAVVNPTVGSEVARQIADLAPNEKVDYLIKVTPPYLMNRLVWVLLPVGLLLILLRRLKREHLLLDNNKKTGRENAVKESASVVKTPAQDSVIVSDKPSWLRALLSEALWHLRLSLQNRGLLLALGILVLMSVSTSIMFILQNGQGPMIPRVEYLLSFSGTFFYLLIMFAVAGFVGTMMRRDKHTGFEEMLDTAPAPLGTRVMARILAAFLLTMVLALFPALNTWIVMAIGGVTVSWCDPLVFRFLVMMPAMLEICALSVLSHTLIRNAGAAYGVSMLFGFIAIMNMEVGLVTYPPAQVGIAMGMSLSSLSGWQPWIGNLIATDLLKLGVVTLLASLAWLSWQRGGDTGFAKRRHMACSRIRNVAPLGIVGLLLITIPAVVLYQKLVVHGEYQSLDAELAEDAAWEQQWWEKGCAYSLQGGEVRIQVNPSERTVTAQWTLNDVRTVNGLLHGSLPHGVSITSAVVEGKDVVPDTAYDHFTLPLDSCPAQGCDAKLTLTAALQDWSVDKVQSWLLPSGVWLRAADVLPALGLDPDRRLRIPAERAQFGLPKLTENLPRHAMQAAEAVAPAGSWRWSVEIEDGGVSTQNSGSLTGPLDFAMVWLPKTPEQTTQNGVQAWHGHEYGQAAKDILMDLQLMAQCVGDLLGKVPDVRYVIQAPRELGEIVQYGKLLWLPENLGWDVDSKGPGRKRRRAAIASALSRHILLQAADLRAEPGAEWLLSGVSGWVGMECLRRSDGQQAWIAEQNCQSKELSKALNKGLEAPVRRVADAGKAEWIKPYTALSTLNWAAGQGSEQTCALIKALLKRLQNDEPLPEALTGLAGQQTAEHLLGMPVVADIALRVDDKQQVQIKAQRWQWHDKGWQLIEPPREILQLVKQETQLLDLQKSAEISNAQDFVVLDSRPSVERTPKDNVWRHAAKP
jgi:ABC-type transport system involved in multi-copper enzyme maturation permease subunit